MMAYSPFPFSLSYHPVKSSSTLSASSRSDDDLPTDVQYRQLVSRAMTQRLHTPSLSSRPSSTIDTNIDIFKAWEKAEREQAKEKAKAHADTLGVQ
jgi:hypothetical protein